ncbi:MAG: gliding-motility protein MglA [Candidatus Hydrothermota bacterium]|nr:MAG: gliding-motility protein MglA [Candidatus Hydrothermae bacterium]
MMIDAAKKEIKFKIVYYGPGLSGKTTNIVYIYSKFPGLKGNLVTIDTKGERTLFFDFLPIEIEIIKGYKTRFYLYTVPGQVFYKTTRRLVLKNADGIIYVADSQRNRLKDNIDTHKEMYEHMKYYDMSRENIPIVMQYNKRDLPDILTIEELEREVNWYHYPYFPAIAIKGVGVFKTLEAIIREVVKRSFAKAKELAT